MHAHKGRTEPKKADRNKKRHRQTASQPTNHSASQTVGHTGQTLKAAAPLPAVTSEIAAFTAGLVSVATAHCLMAGYLSMTPEGDKVLLAYKNLATYNMKI